MSTRGGNHAKKGQRHQNVRAFKNDLHDTSKRTKQINALVVGGVCARCREVIEWKKKYKKYKPLTAPKKCVRCKQRTIKHAYHTVCSRCAEEAKLCEKCGKVQEIVRKSEPSPSERASEDSKLQQEIKSMTERQRRTYFRHREKGVDDLKAPSHDTQDDVCRALDLITYDDDDEHNAKLSDPDELQRSQLAS